MDIYEKMILGQSLDELTRLPSIEETVSKLEQQILSNYPLRVLGIGTEGEVPISEEDRESHIHVLGSPGEGKSKFLELLLRQDIDSGYGACLIDPSDNGDTCYKVLKYAIRKGYQKIVLIDPHDFRTYGVPCLNPIHTKAPAPAVVGNLMDAIRVLWGQKEGFETPRINKYLPALLTALHAAGMTLAEARYFMANSPLYRPRRERIVSQLDPFSLHRQHLEEAFATRLNYESFQSTVNRLQPFLDPTMELMFGSQQGLHFQDLVSQGYLVLVNLDPEGVYGQEHQRLLGTIIINEITYAISRLRNGGWRGVYYLYIDEAGDYATSKLSYILDKKRKSGLRLTLSHQRFDQFSDKDVSSAVYGGTKIKVLFNTASREDRDKMIRMMYGGEVSDREASYALSQLKKQHAVIKINKMPPVSMRLTDVPDVQMSAKDLNDWKAKHYTNAFYRQAKAVREEINNRFAIRTPAQHAPHPNRSQTNQQPQAPRDNPQGTIGQPNVQPSPREDTPSPPRKSVFDSVPDSETVLRDKKERKAGKVVPPPAEAG
jgi:hypothetical protein